MLQDPHRVGLLSLKVKEIFTNHTIYSSDRQPENEYISSSTTLGDDRCVQYAAQVWLSPEALSALILSGILPQSTNEIELANILFETFQTVSFLQKHFACMSSPGDEQTAVVLLWKCN